MADMATRPDGWHTRSSCDAKFMMFAHITLCFIKKSMLGARLRRIDHISRVCTLLGRTEHVTFKTPPFSLKENDRQMCYRLQIA